MFLQAIAINFLAIDMDEQAKVSASCGDGESTQAFPVPADVNPMTATLGDVAERAGVSRSAVSRAFTPGASVSKKTRAKVEMAARELGYTPNYIARSLVTRRTQLIGVVCNNFHNPYLLEVFEIITQQLQARNLRPLLVNLSGETDPEQSVVLLRQYRVEGVIVASSTLPTSFSSAFGNAAMPCVHLFGRASKSPLVNVVGVDNCLGGRLAARSLIECGYGQLIFLGGPKTATSTQDRESGFSDEARRLGQRVLPPVFASNYTYESGYKAMKNLLKNSQPEGVFCGDDIIAMGALAAVRGHGIKVPGQLGIIGFNNTEMSGWPGIEVSTINQPTKEIVQSAVELMHTMLVDSGCTAQTRIFSCSLINRGTLRVVR